MSRVGLVGESIAVTHVDDPRLVYETAQAGAPKCTRRQDAECHAVFVVGDNSRPAIQRPAIQGRCSPGPQEGPVGERLSHP